MELWNDIAGNVSNWWGNVTGTGTKSGNEKAAQVAANWTPTQVSQVATSVNPAYTTSYAPASPTAQTYYNSWLKDNSYQAPTYGPSNTVASYILGTNQAPSATPWDYYGISEGDWNLYKTNPMYSTFYNNMNKGWNNYNTEQNTYSKTADWIKELPKPASDPYGDILKSIELTTGTPQYKALLSNILTPEQVSAYYGPRPEDINFDALQNQTIDTLNKQAMYNIQQGTRAAQNAMGARGMVGSGMHNATNAGMVAGANRDLMNQESVLANQMGTLKQNQRGQNIGWQQGLASAQLQNNATVGNVLNNAMSAVNSIISQYPALNAQAADQLLRYAVNQIALANNLDPQMVYSAVAGSGTGA